MAGFTGNTITTPNSGVGSGLLPTTGAPGASGAGFSAAGPVSPFSSAGGFAGGGAPSGNSGGGLGFLGAFGNTPGVSGPAKQPPDWGNMPGFSGPYKGPIAPGGPTAPQGPAKEWWWGAQGKDTPLPGTPGGVGYQAPNNGGVTATANPGVTSPQQQGQGQGQQLAGNHASGLPNQPPSGVNPQLWSQVLSHLGSTNFGRAQGPMQRPQEPNGQPRGWSPVPSMQPRPMMTDPGSNFNMGNLGRFTGQLTAQDAM